MRINIIRKNGYTIFKHEYVNLTDFLATLLNSDINYEIFGSKLASEDEDFSFTNTNSFGEAWNMCRFGWNENFEKFRDEIRRIQLQYVYNFRMVNTYKPIGSSPSVPRYLLGLPNNMHYKEKVRDKKIIDVYFNISYSSITSTRQIINRGVLTLALIEYLEKTNFFSINLHFIKLVRCDNEILYLDIPLKNSKEQLNIKKCYFPIVNPSFSRRLCFRALEITLVKNNNWRYGYGMPMTFSEVEFLMEGNLEDSIYISSPMDMGIRGDDILEDLEAFINIINDKYSSVLEDSDSNKYTRKRSR